MESRRSWRVLERVIIDADIHALLKKLARSCPQYRRHGIHFHSHHHSKVNWDFQDMSKCTCLRSPQYISWQLLSSNKIRTNFRYDTLSQQNGYPNAWQSGAFCDRIVLRVLQLLLQVPTTTARVTARVRVYSSAIWIKRGRPVESRWWHLSRRPEPQSSRRLC